MSHDLCAGAPQTWRKLTWRKLTWRKLTWRKLKRGLFVAGCSGWFPLALLSACAGGPARPTTLPHAIAAARPQRLAVIVDTRGTAGARVDGLLRALRTKDEHLLVLRVGITGSTASSSPALASGADAARRAAAARTELDRALATAEGNYLRMQMERAREILDRALERVRQRHGLGATHAQLFRAHLFLAAVSYARQRSRRFHEHCRAAVSYGPREAVNTDLFSPPVQACIRRARVQGRAAELSLAIEPPDAELRWDGRRQGSARVIRAPYGGEHFLWVDHPFYLPWGKSVHLSSDAHLSIRLHARPPAAVGQALIAAPELLAAAPAALTCRAVLLVQSAVGGLSARFASGREAWEQQLGQTASPQVLDALASRTRASLAKVEAAWVNERTHAAAPARTGRSQRWRRYLWWGVAGAAAIAAAVAIPLATRGETSPVAGGRPARIELP